MTKFSDFLTDENKKSQSHQEIGSSLANTVLEHVHVQRCMQLFVIAAADGAKSAKKLASSQ